MDKNMKRILVIAFCVVLMVFGVMEQFNSIRNGTSIIEEIDIINEENTRR